MKYLAMFTFMLLIPATTFAHPGNTDSSGGHTCRTNCPKWGLSYGQYHYHHTQKAAPVVKKKHPITCGEEKYPNGKSSG